jgi:hypothetical protein
MLNSTSTATRAILGILLFLLLAAPLAKVSDPQSRSEKKIERAEVRQKLTVFGDSRAHAGVNPELMIRMFADAGIPDVTEHNLAENGTDAVQHYNLIATNLLEKPGPPSVILWTPNPLSFDDTRTANRLEQIKAANLVPMFRAGAPLESLLDVATMAVYRPYRHRPQILLGIEGRVDIAAEKLAPLQAAVLGLSYTKEPERRKYIDYPDGYNPFRVLALWEDSFTRSLRFYRGQYKDLKLSEWRFRLAREMMQKTREAGCLLVVLELPVAPAYNQELASTEKHQAFRERLSRMAKEEGAIWISHADHFKDDHAFGDPAHMVEATAEEYSAFLATTLLAEPSVRHVLSPSSLR